MLTDLELIEDNENLTKFSINPVPKLMVIAGSNGSGKTAFLNLLNTLNLRTTAPALRTQNKGRLRGKLKYVEVGFVPGDIGITSRNARTESEDKKRQFINYLRNGKWGNSPFKILSLNLIRQINPEIQQLDSEAKKVIQGLSDADLLLKIPSDFLLHIQNYQNNEFISEVFLTHLSRQNTKKLQLYDLNLIKSNEEIEAEIGRSPWDKINDLFEKYNFHYRISPLKKVFNTHQPSTVSKTPLNP